MSEPDDNIPCSDSECCKSRKAAQNNGAMRKTEISEDEVTNSPLKDYDDKISPLRASIHEMITSEVAFDRHDLEPLLAQIEQMQAQIDKLTEQNKIAVENLKRERSFRMHIQRTLRNQEAKLTAQ